VRPRKHVVWGLSYCCGYTSGYLSEKELWQQDFDLLHGKKAKIEGIFQIFVVSG